MSRQIRDARLYRSSVLVQKMRDDLNKGDAMTDRTRRRLTTALLAPVAALATWAVARLARLDPEVSTRSGKDGPPHAVPAPPPRALSRRPPPAGLRPPPPPPPR